MKDTLTIIVTALLVASCGQEPTESAFVTVLGSDTLAVELFSHSPELTEARVVLRTPTTRLYEYRLETTSAGHLVRYEETVFDPPGAAESSGHETVTLEGDSLVMEAEGEAPEKTSGHGGVLPFIDMVHWPFELALMRAHATGSDSVVQDLLSGSSVRPFIIRRLAADSMTIQHPTRGIMGVHTDAAGHILLLDAAATTRKLRVVRTAGLDVDAIAERFAAQDRAGRSFGALSGRGAAESQIHGAAISVDYGTPSKRGRVIFGGIVPYGERWRTGANRATHFATDRDLGFEALTVPAGEYTLSMIPQPDSSLLIINTQTGQGGTTYNRELDLGRVPLERSALTEPVEVFRISVEETDSGGRIHFDWDTTRLSAAFAVR